MFQTSIPNINLHIRNIYEEGELEQEATIKEYLIVQNKHLYAVTGKTAAELIHDRVDVAKPNMGLTTWKGAGRGRVLTKQDTEIAKNYLGKEEVETLELLVGQFLDFAELQAKRKKVMYMTDWKDKLDDFLRFNEREILVNAGTISTEVAKELAHSEYERFSTNRRALEADLADEELHKTYKKLISEGK